MLKGRSQPAFASSQGSGAIAALKQALTEQRLLWSGFTFAVGIFVYFSLPEEPNFWAVAGLFGAGLIVVVRKSRTAGVGVAGMLVFSALCGVFLSDLRTALVVAPRLVEEKTVQLTGWVVDRDMGLSGPRLTIDVLRFEGTAGRDLSLPERVRVSVPDTPPVGIGEGVSVRARLFPPAGPVRPGGYDFSFRAYFDGLGATGFALKPPKPLNLGAPPWNLAAKRRLAELRQGISRRIIVLIGEGNAAALASALLVGDRSGLSEDSEEALRRSGLAHILAISGLHMALFAGGAYAAFLMLLSLSETVSLHYQTHRIAAVAALLVAICYLFLSGASVATQRSFIMVFLVFLSILSGRRGLTLRSVALAGLVLLGLAPERLFYPGFQMSFAAVICLVAVYETWRKRQAERLQTRQAPGLAARFLATLAKWIFGLFLTALVAGTATGLIGAYHFGRIAPFGIVGNMLGMPVFSLLVMPMGVLALVVMPFGLAALPLKAMGAGLELLLAIAEWTASLDAGSGTVAVPAASTAFFAIAALFGLVLLPGKLRAMSLMPLALAVVAAHVSPAPDIQIADKGGLIAARDPQGRLRIDARRSGFAVATWLQLEGLDETAFADARMTAAQFACDRDGCVYHAYPAPSGKSLFADLWSVNGSAKDPGDVQPLKLALPKSPEALVHDCRFADIIVTEFVAPAHCRAGLVVDADKRQSLGAISIWLSAQTETGAGMWRAKIASWQAAKTVPPRPWHR